MPRVKQPASIGKKKKQKTPASARTKKPASGKGNAPASARAKGKQKASSTPANNSVTRKPSAGSGNPGPATSKPAPTIRNYKVPASVQAKWRPLPDSTRAHVLQASESAVNSVLAGSGAALSRADTHKHLQELQNRVSRELEDAIGPVPAKKRRLSHAVLLSANKRVEDTLLATYRQVSHLERELAKETEQMEEDDAHLKSYVSRMKDAKAHHKRERSSKLHPQLRKAPKPSLDLDDTAWESTFTCSGSGSSGGGTGSGNGGADRVGTSTSAADEDGNGDGDGDGKGDADADADADADQDLINLQTSLYQTLSRVKSKASSFEAWLSTVHSIAALTAASEDDA